MHESIVVSSTESEDCEGTSKRDILAMLSMLDYLIAQMSEVDPMSTHCLVLARKSLETAATRRAVGLN
jgi:hypothetical protein